jgi:nitrate/nitrite transporter NarK
VNSLRLFGFSITNILAMAVGSLLLYALSVIAPFIVDDLRLSRFEVGALGTLLMLTASIIAVRGGTLVDALGGRRVLILLLVCHVAATFVISAAPSFAAVALGSSVAGIVLALSNPVTNQLISIHVSGAVQGWIVGLKQSGVQASAVLCGTILPTIASIWSWRVAIGTLAAVGPITAMLAMATVPHDPPSTRPLKSKSVARPPASEFVQRLAVYGFLMSAGTVQVVLFLPLFVFEQFSTSPQVAGFSAALLGITGTVARVAWGPLAVRWPEVSGPLVILGSGACLAIVMFLGSMFVGVWLVWPAVVLFGATGMAWNTPAMLAIIRDVATERTGRSSGLVMRGVYGGGVASPLIFGWLIDQFQSYTSAWLLSAALLGAAALSGKRLRDIKEND